MNNRAFNTPRDEEDFILDNGDEWSNDVVEDRTTGMLRYRHSSAPKRRAENTKIKGSSQSSRDFAKRYGLKALTGTSAKQKEFAEDLRKEVLMFVDPELRVGLRGLSKASDYTRRSREIRSGDCTFFGDYARANAEYEREVDEAREAEKERKAEARKAERAKHSSPIFKRIASVAKAFAIDVDVKKAFFGTAEKWEPLKKLSDNDLAEFVRAKAEMSRIDTNDQRWHDIKASIIARHGFYI